MPTLDEFKEKQKKFESKKNEIGFKPKRYAPYLLQEEVIKVSENDKNIVSFNAFEDPEEKSEVFLRGKNKPTEELVAGFYGIKKKIIFYFLELCEKRGDLTTGPVTSEALVKASGSTYKTIKRILQDMVEDKLIIRKNGKRGRGGFSIFIISAELKDELLKYKQLMQHVKYELKNTISEPDGQKNDNIFTSNNSLDFQKPIINIEPLLKIGLTNQHLDQIFSYGKLSPKIIQDSINHFAFDLSHNDKARTLKKSPLDFFIGILRQGHPYTAPSNYESPEDEAMRKYLDSKRQQEQASKKLEEELRELEWKTWSEDLTDQALAEFYLETESMEGVPERVKVTLKQRNALSNARQYFETNIWPQKRKNILEKSS